MAINQLHGCLYMEQSLSDIAVLKVTQKWLLLLPIRPVCVLRAS